METSNSSRSCGEVLKSGIQMKKMKIPVDRVSSLPTGVVHHILSFLDMRCAVQTSILSTSWRYLWTSLPFLNFVSTMFDDSTGTSSEKHREHFINFVDKVLILRDGSDIQKFRLDYSCQSLDLCPQQFYSWICAAVRRNVQELDLDISNEEQLDLPHCLFTSKSIKILKLCIYWAWDVQYKYNFELPDSISMSTLTALHFKRLRFGDEKLIHKLFSGCPVLESFSLEICEFDLLQNFVISAPKLNTLSLYENEDIQLDGCCKIKIYAPELTSFDFSGGFEFGSGYHFECCSAIDNASIKISIKEYFDYLNRDTFRDDIAIRKKVLDEWTISCLHAVRDVKVLTLSDASFIEFLSEPPTVLEGSSLRFCNVTYLEMYTWLSRDSIHAVLHFLNISPNIETLCEH